MKAKSKVIYTAPSEGFWDIPNVNYRGEIGTYRLFEKMTNPMTQDKLAELYEREKSNERPHPIDSILQFAIMEQVANSGEKDLVSLVRNGLGRDPSNLSRVIYNPTQLDEAVHNYQTSDEYTLSGNLVGEDGWIKDLKNKTPLRLFLGTQGIKRINKTFEVMTQKLMYLWRFDLKPSEKIERVVRLGTVVDGLGLVVGSYLSFESPAFRVLRVD